MRLLLLGLCLALLALAAAAHEHVLWYRTLRQPGTGLSCCNEMDCRPAEARIAGDRWEARIGDAWVPIPPEKVLRVANPTGEPTLCHIGTRILCFVPASGV